MDESVKDYLPDLFTRLENDPKLRGDDLWFHFSRVPKLGVNPSPSHRDPYGIYMFPKRWVVNHDLAKNHAFFGMPYVFVLRIRPGARMLDLGAMTREQAVGVLTSMGLQDRVPLLDAPSRYGGTTVGAIFWQILDQFLEPQRGANGAWNALFRKAGFDGCIDPGTAAVHSNEPDQALVFSPTSLEVVEVIEQRPDRAVPSIIRGILTRIADSLFGKGAYRFETSQWGVGRDRYHSASGEYNGRRFKVGMTQYKSWSDDPNRIREFGGEVVMYSLDTRDQPSERDRVDVPYDETRGVSVDDQIARVVARFRDFAEKVSQDPVHKEDVSRKLAEVSAEVFHYFGLPAPKVKPGEDYVGVTREYDWGSFSLRVFHRGPSSWDPEAGVGFGGQLNLYATRRGDHPHRRDALGNTLYADPKQVFHEETPAGDLAPLIVRSVLDKAREAIYTHYHPDPDKHWSDYSRYEWADRGRRFLAVLGRIEAIPPIRRLLGERTPRNEYEADLTERRREIDLKEFLKTFYARHPKLAALKVPVHYQRGGEGVGAVSRHGGGVVVRDAFYALDKPRKDYALAELAGRWLLGWHLGPKFLGGYVSESDLPFGASDLEQAFATCFARYVVLGDDLHEHPEWLGAVRAGYLKGVARA